VSWIAAYLAPSQLCSNVDVVSKSTVPDHRAQSVPSRDDRDQAASIEM